MAYPFFSLAKSKRTVPIDFRAGKITIRVEAVPDHGMATIWDADVLIWAASQIVEARDGGLKTSRLMAATPYEILTFVGRGTSARDYDRLKAALDRLQSTTIMTSIRQPTERRRHRFSWINEWKETADLHGRPLGRELILPDWFYAGVLQEALVLTIDRAYFDLTGGLERWLYRLVRKHGGRQDGGWSFDLIHLHGKSGSLSPLKHFAYDLREIVRRQTLPGYRLIIEAPAARAARNVPCRSKLSAPRHSHAEALGGAPRAEGLQRSPHHYRRQHRAGRGARTRQPRSTAACLAGLSCGRRRRSLSHELAIGRLARRALFRSAADDRNHRTGGASLDR
jgi:plasmid replication initiation protein